MKNVCDYCGWQKNRKPDSWFCRKYGIPMYSERTYCVSKERKDAEIPQQENGSERDRV